MQPGGARDQNSDQDKLFSEPAPPPGDHVGSDDLQGLTLNPSASTWAPDAAQAQPAGFHQEDDHAPRWQATEAPAPPPQPGRGRRGGLSNALEGGPQPPRARGRGGAAVNANWLLNVRGYQGSSESSSSSRPRRGRGGGGGPKRPARPAAPFDRDLFVLANSRFLVSDAVDVAAHGMDPDRIVEWADVARVTVLIPQPLQCPISLESPPRCPQITPCGHTFSFGAIMQHLATHDGPGAAPCPLCFSPLTAKDLRSLEAVPAAPPAPGRPSSFALVRCPKGSGHPRPAASGVAPLGGGGEDVREEVFSKLSVTADATPVFLHDARELGREVAELAAEAEGCEEARMAAPFLNIAAEALAHRARAWVERRATVLDRRFPNRSDPRPSLLDARAARERVLEAFESALSLASHTRALDASFPALASSPPPRISSPAPDRAPAAARARPSASRPVPRGERESAGGGPAGSGGSGSGPKLPPAPEGEWVFFQDAAGQLAFVHPLSMRVLVHHFGYYDTLPDVVTANVLEVEEMVLDADGRKKLKFLSHLPLTSTIHLVELDLSPLLPPEALEPFAGELGARAKRRERAAKRDKADDRRRRKQEEAERKARLGPTQAELMAMPALSTSMGTSEGDAAAAQESKDGHPWGGAGTSPGAQGVSFARMTRLGLAAGGEGGPSLQDVYRGGEGGQSGVWQAPGAAGAWGRRPTVVQEVAGEAQSPGDDGDGAGMVSLGSLMVGRGEGGRKGKGKGKGGGKKTTLFTIG